ncbi:hypothetical protein IQ07DRAFT_656487 [Pyrenochaeta sp. DS3sAY3a]|nr:hypothetical protein IQ07DRAFT_656487 [Pyrenochaeta sp. DS3sAY3a]
MAPANLRVGLLQRHKTTPYSNKPITEPPKKLSLLSLSPELRNCIYSHAAHEPLFFTYPQNGKATHKRQFEKDPLNPRKKLTTIPFLGLTQTCILLRTEFRPLWLATHRVAFSCIPGYMRAFYPDDITSVMPSHILTRLESFHDTRCILQLWFRIDDLNDGSIMPLLKFRVRYPETKIMINNGDAGDLDPQNHIGYLTWFLNTSGEELDSWIRRKGIMDVRLDQQRHPNKLFIKLVVSRKQAGSLTPSIRCTSTQTMVYHIRTT